MALPQPRNKSRKQLEHRINEAITSDKIKLILEGEAPTLYQTNEARKLAYDMNLDLVEISSTGELPLCKIIDYNKFLYDRKKKKKESKNNSNKSVTKEIKMSRNIGQHDIDFKAKNSAEFLKIGHKVKVVIMFKGRDMANLHKIKEQTEVLLFKFYQNVGEEICKVEQLPKLEGKFLTMILTPKKK